MRMTIRGALAVALALALAACGGGTPAATSIPQPTQETPIAASSAEDTTPETNPSPTETAAPEPGVVGRVNGVPITQAEFDAAFVRRAREESAADTMTLATQVLDMLIEQQLVAQGAAKMGIVVTDEDVAQELQGLRSMVNSDEEWQEFLRQNGYSEDELRAAQRDTLLSLRVQEYLMATLQGNIPQVRARHIVVRSEAEANTILNALSAGANFAALALQSSTDVTTRESGGELGWFTRTELLDARLAEIAFALEPNQIAGPIPTRIGYHILQTLEKAERPIEPERLTFLTETLYNQWLAQESSTAQIERFR